MRYYLTALLAVLIVAVGATATTARATSTESQCYPFRNTARVITFARSRLTYIGFHPNIQFTCGPGWIRLLGVIDGERYQGAISKVGPRRIRIGISEHPTYPPGRALYTSSALYDIPFYA